MKEDFTKKVKELGLPLGEYVVTGSGILAALGLREANDIDMAVTDKLFKELQATGKFKEESRYDKLFLIGDEVDIASQLNWNEYATTTEEAIKSAMIIDGVPFLNIEQTILFKTAMGREKDLRDIELLKNYLKNLTN